MTNPIASIFNHIMGLLQLAEFEQTQCIYMKEPVLVGVVNGERVINPASDRKLVYCTSISKSSEGGFYMNVIFNERLSKLYGNDWDFTFACYIDDTGKVTFTERCIKLSIQMDESAIFEVAHYLNLWGKQWIDYQRDIQIKSRKYHLWAVSRKEDKTPLTWIEQLDWMDTKAIIEKLSWNRRRNIFKEQSMKMEAMGETKWAEKTAQENEMAEKIMKEIEDESSK